MRSLVATAVIALVLLWNSVPTFAQEDGGSREFDLAEIVRLLSSKDVEDRRYGVEFAGSCGAAVVPYLVVALDDEDPEVREAAAYTLGEMGATAAPAVKPLVARLELRSGFERDNIIEVLLHLSVAVPEAERAVRKLIREGKREFRLEVLMLLQFVDEIADGLVADLVELSFDPDETLQTSAMCALTSTRRRGELALPMLVSRLATDDVDRLFDITWLLGSLLDKTPEALPVLVDLLEHPEYLVRSTVVSRFSYSPERCGSVAPILIRALDDHRLSLHWSISRALFSIGPHARDVLGEIQELLQSPHASSAAFGLGMLACRNDETIPALRKAAKSAEPKIRGLSLFALWVLTGEQAGVPEALVLALDPDSPDHSVCHALGYMGPLAAPAVPQLTAMLKQEGHMVLASGALLGISKLKAEKLPELIECLSSEDPAERRTAIAKLGALGPQSPAPIPALLAHLRTAEVEEKLLVIGALAEMELEARAARFDLMRIRDTEPEDSPLGAAARQALKLIG